MLKIVYAYLSFGSWFIHQTDTDNNKHADDQTNHSEVKVVDLSYNTESVVWSIAATWWGSSCPSDQKTDCTHNKSNKNPVKGSLQIKYENM